MVTVGEILKLPSLSRCHVLSGRSGLNRTVQGWNVAERFDFYLWMKGGEFIMSMMSFASDSHSEEEISSWVKSLIESGASALGIKRSIYNGKIPQFLLEIGDWNSFPIIEMDDDLSLPAVGEEIITRILAGKADTLKKVLDTFSEITLATVEGWMPEFVRALSEAFNNPVLLETPNMNLVSACDSQKPHESQILSSRRDASCVSQIFAKLSRPTSYKTIPTWGLRFIEHEFFVQNKEYRQLTFPVEISRHFYGYISVIQVNKEFDADDLLLMRVAVNTTALVALKDSTYEIQDEIRLELFNAIIDPIRKNEAENRAKLYGFDYETPSFCVVAQLVGSESSVGFINDTHISRLSESLRSIDPDVLVIRHHSSIVIFCHILDDRISKKQKIVKTGFQERFGYVLSRLESQKNLPKFRLGVGRPGAGIVSLRLSFDEAVASIRIAARFELSRMSLSDTGQYPIVQYYSLLDGIMQDKTRAKNFCGDVLGHFMASRIKHKEDYYETLETYLFYNQNLSDIYRNTGLHRNTVKYRIEKIKEILNIDLNDIQTKLSVWIALQVRKHLALSSGDGDGHTGLADSRKP
ncbi:MAG: PucR family transcriptional regulator ligand-binding domain-containing protein [Deltaproteobacteria bacterium]|jgi:purine catabolism regulator|nr:PucR family transcriptional regulator ligand-binding domain-containing protein [Deltaproteobacteria bacterium]